MDPSDAIQLISIFVLIIISAFFTSVETAVTAISKSRALSLAENGKKNAVVLQKIVEKHDQLVCTIILGNTLTNIAIAVSGTLFAVKHFHNIGLIIIIVVLTLLMFIFARILPQTLTTMNSEKTALAFAGILRFLIVLFAPIVFIALKLGDITLKLFGLDPAKRTPAITEDDLRSIVDVSHEEGVIEQEEKQMIHNVFDFSDTQAKDIMVPRIDMTFLNIDTTYDDLINIHNENTYTRYPVYADSTDSVIGTINTKDLLFYDNRKDDFSLVPFLREPYFTYEHKNSSALFIEMRDQSINFAIVLDEYGATAGLITMEDMLEEIVGDIRDEYDDAEEEKTITTIVEGHEYIVRGDAKLDDIYNELKLNLESAEYDSIGGYIIERLDRIPDEEEDIRLEDGTLLVIDKLSNNRIELVHVFRADNEPRMNE